MYHSPGLRDGVLTQGTCVRPCPPDVLGAESISIRITMTGNKFGCPQVPKFGWGCLPTLFESHSLKTWRMLLDFRGVDSLSEHRIVCSSLPSKLDESCPQRATGQRRGDGNASAKMRGHRGFAKYASSSNF